MSKLFTEYNSLIEKLLKKAEDLNVYVVARFQSSAQFVESYKKGAIESVGLYSDKGVGMYVFTKSGHVAFSSANDLSDENSILQLLENTAKVAKKNQEKGFSAAKEIFDLPKQENLGEDQLHYSANDLSKIDANEVAKKFKHYEDFLKNLDKDINSEFFLRARDERWRIVRSDGTDVDFALPKFAIYVEFSIKDGENTVSTYVRRTSAVMQDLFDGDYEDLEKELQWNYECLKDQMKAETVKPGHYPLILDSDLAGVLTHEAFGHACESDSVSENGSILADKDSKFISGTKVAANGVNIYDDEPELCYGFHPYGAFGNKRERVALVENGVLKESISDIFSAEKIGVENKNCERSQNFSSIAIPRMSTTTLELDKSKLKDLPEDLNINDLKKVHEFLVNNGFFEKHDKAIYMMKMMGGSVTQKTGDFMFGTAFSYELTKDEIIPLKPCTFSGAVLEAMKSISSGYGDIRRNHGGNCGKMGQTANVNQGGHKLIIFEKSDFVNIT